MNLAQLSLPSAETPIQPWHWRSRPLNHRTGSEIFQALYVDAQTGQPRGAIATLLESPARSPGVNADLSPQALTRSGPDQANPQRQHHTQTPRYSICAGAPRTVAHNAQVWTPPMGNHLATLRTLLHRSQDVSLAKRSSPSSAGSQPPHHLPFHGGWLGWLGYDVAWEIEVLPDANTDPLPFPVSFWYEPETFAVLDHQDQILWLAATQASDLERLESAVSGAADSPPAEASRRPQEQKKKIDPGDSGPSLTFLSEQQDYEQAVQKAKEYIQAGDVFQSNLSLRFSTQTSAPSWRIYQALQQVNPSPFSSYWHTPWGDVVSCSPERLVKVRDRIVETRPIAGTRPRGTTLEEDRAYERELTGNRKENAEHIMLVDLERNDLGRVCEWGTVQVDELLTIERYSHVMHLVSNVIGTLAPDQTVVDVIQSLFPGGTITGCPKVRCMEIIEELEPVRRSLFYGSCGYVDLRGRLDLNILIRTLLCEAQSPERLQNQPPRTVWGQVGAGIVADSDPSREWVESLNKAKAQLQALTLANYPDVH